MKDFCFMNIYSYLFYYFKQIMNNLEKGKIKLLICQSCYIFAPSKN
jgi:hypothetical protein